MKRLRLKHLKGTQTTKKKRVFIVVSLVILVLAATTFFVVTTTKKSDVDARASAEKAAKLLSDDKKKNASEAVKLLNKSIKQAENPQEMQEKKAAICSQFGLYDCAIDSYEKLASTTNEAIFYKKLADTYRYAKNKTKAVETYEQVKKLCESASGCEGIATREIDYFINQLKADKPIVENQ
jgi:tetratricopeptide (TPR) repeat protein